MNHKTICSQCGQSFLTYKAWAERREHHFCCEPCRSLWFSEQYSGSGNPNYLDGRSLVETDPEFYGHRVSDDPYFLAWLAGLVDGEGTFVFGLRVAQTSKDPYRTLRFQPSLAIKMHVREKVHLDYIHSFLGLGRRYLNRDNTETWQTTKIWEAFKISCVLWPHLRIKKRQAEIFIEACCAADWYSSHGGYNGNVERLWHLCQLRDNINPGTYRNRRRVEFTKPQIEDIVAEQKVYGLAGRNKPSKITPELLSLVPRELPSITFPRSCS